MRKALRAQEDEPAGFKRHYLAGGLEVLLPLRLAQEYIASQRQRQADEEARRAEEQLRKHQEFLANVKQENRRAEGKANGPSPRSVWRKVPRSGWYRVLPGLPQLAAELAAPDSMDRSADKDVNERRKRIVERLLARGPDRRVAMPPQWQAAVDELERTLPHFAGPIRSLRHAL